MRPSETINVFSEERYELLPTICLEPQTNQNLMVGVRGVDWNFVEVLHHMLDIGGWLSAVECVFLEISARNVASSGLVFEHDPSSIMLISSRLDGAGLMPIL